MKGGKTTAIYAVAEEYLDEDGDVCGTRTVHMASDEDEALSQAELHRPECLVPTQVCLWTIEDGICTDSRIVQAAKVERVSILFSETRENARGSLTMQKVRRSGRNRWIIRARRRNGEERILADRSTRPRPGEMEHYMELI